MTHLVTIDLSLRYNNYMYNTNVILIDVTFHVVIGSCIYLSQVKDTEMAKTPHPKTKVLYYMCAVFSSQCGFADLAVKGQSSKQSFV